MVFDRNFCNKKILICSGMCQSTVCAVLNLQGYKMSNYDNITIDMNVNEPKI